MVIAWTEPQTLNILMELQIHLRVQQQLHFLPTGSSEDMFLVKAHSCFPHWPIQTITTFLKFITKSSLWSLAVFSAEKSQHPVPFWTDLPPSKPIFTAFISFLEEEIPFILARLNFISILPCNQPLLRFISSVIVFHFCISNLHMNQHITFLILSMLSQFFNP